MNTLNLEQVKEHFKYAKEVKCLSDGDIFDITKSKGIVQESNYDVILLTEEAKEFNCVLYLSDTNQLAEILTYVFDRGEEVEVSDNKVHWNSYFFVGMNRKNQFIVENNVGIPLRYTHIRKLTPESLLEPQLSEFKKFAESKMNCTVTVIFENK